MPSVNVTINMKADWHEQEADGSACFGCGDAIWLKAWGLVVSVFDSGSGKQLGVTKQPEVLICDSCHSGIVNHA